MSFRNGDDVYAEFASSRIQPVHHQEDHPAERFIGKTAILGLGYGCGS